MPDVLAIHWDKRRLRVVEATIGSTVQVTQSFLVEVPEPLTSNWLRDALKRQGVTARQAIVCLPRDEAILRQLELPDAPDDELPALVHFQVSTRSTTPLDQLLLDYLPLPRRTGAIQRDVLVATVPRTSVDPIRATLTEAGLDLSVLTISSFAFAELALRAEQALGQAATGSRLVVVADANRLEVVLLGKQQPMVAHLVRPPLDDQGRPMVAKAAADISRVLVTMQPWLSTNPIDQIHVLADSSEWDGLEQALQDRWQSRVERFGLAVIGKIRDLDLKKFEDSLPQFGAAIGMSLGRLHARAPGFDLLHPRQPKARRNPRKLQLAVGSASALVVIALFTSYYQLTMRGLETQIEKTRKSLSEVTTLSKAGDPKRKAAVLIENWKTRDIDQLKKFVELHELMGGTQRLYISDYNFAVKSGDVVNLTASGSSKERTDWQQLAQNMVDTKTFRVRARDVSQQSRDPDYPNRFQLDTDLLSPVKAVKAGTSSSTGAKDK
jgi:Tfp pilus assembly PilM family ATPase